MLTFVDSGVLIAAFRAEGEIVHQAMAVLIDNGRTFSSSAFVRLEVMPKARYYNRQREIEFYQTFFDSVTVWVDDVAGIVNAAIHEAETHGLAGMDAPHVAAASLAGAEELVTSERSDKPIFRATGIMVTTIRPDREPPA
jgi:predicted nucleic acid-binding protein